MLGRLTINFTRRRNVAKPAVDGKQGYMALRCYEPTLAEGPPWPNINAKNAAATIDAANCRQAVLLIAFALSELRDACVLISTSFATCEEPDEPERLIWNDTATPSDIDTCGIEPHTLPICQSWLAHLLL